MNRHAPESEDNLQLDIDSRGVATLTLARPQVLNAFDEALIAKLTATFGRLAADDDVRIIVLAAAGRAFCAGADIGWMQRAAANAFEENLQDARRFAAMMAAISQCPKPVVARVQGAAYGVGVGLACASDIVIASRSARFCVSEAKFGILPSVIGPYLVNAIGLRQARRLALTCTIVDSDEALSLGLIHQCVDEAELNKAVERCVTDLLLAAPRAQGEIKKLFAQLGVGAIDARVREMTAQAISRVRTGDEARAGFEAFMAKGRPPWADKP